MGSWDKYLFNADPIEFYDIILRNYPATKHNDIRGALSGELVEKFRKEGHVRPGKDAQTDTINILLDGSANDILRSLVEPGIDNLKSGVP